MIKLKKTEILILILTLIYFITAIFIYPYLSETMATHWNAQGVADGFSSKFLGIVIMPFFFAFIFVLYSIFSRTEYFKNKEMEKQLSNTINLTVLFLFYISILSLIYNTGLIFNMNYFLIPGLGLLFIGIGHILKKIKTRNPFFGVRTPWTLLNQKVWEKTHTLGGQLFIILGFVVFFGIFFINYFFVFFLVALFAILITTFVYSYILYKKENRN